MSDELKPCPFCGGEYGGEGYVPKEKADVYIARQAEYMKAFRDGWAKAEAEAAKESVISRPSGRN